MPYENIAVAVLIPCYNEERTIGRVVADFREQLPHARIYVCDNNSTDRTAEIARKAGAIVRCEPMQGKGYALRQLFASVEAQAYVVVDGDATYPAESVHALLEALLSQKLDMAAGARMQQSDAAYRAGHVLGNRLFNRLVRLLFTRGMKDIFTGYRVLSRRFVKSFPALSRGFEIETELAVHALDLGLPFTEIPVPYAARPEGSFSKLNTWGDGLRILATVIRLFKDIRPFALFSSLAALLAVVALLLGYPLWITFLQTHLVPRIPTAIIVVGMLVFSGIFFTSGIILDGIAQLRRENKRLHYLAQDPLP
jgi:glycosyltransferase involved in cell wall biosynthesis